MSVLSTDLPKAFRRIDLRLAREPAHPEGDPAERYVLVAPLQDDGHLDAKIWAEHRSACRVVRHLNGEIAVGHLVRGPGDGWWLHYDVEGTPHDEVVFHLKDERLTAGEYVSIIRDDGAHPYRVASVSTLQAG
jgi:hypothetical protein